jgi:hypothetical protein
MSSAVVDLKGLLPNNTLQRLPLHAIHAAINHHLKLRRQRGAWQPPLRMLSHVADVDLRGVVDAGGLEIQASALKFVENSEDELSLDREASGRIVIKRGPSYNPAIRGVSSPTRRKGPAQIPCAVLIPSLDGKRALLRFGKSGDRERTEHKLKFGFRKVH